MRVKPEDGFDFHGGYDANARLAGTLLSFVAPRTHPCIAASLFTAFQFPIS